MGGQFLHSSTLGQLYPTFWQRLFPLEFSVEEGLGNACSQGGNIWGKVGDYRTAADLLVL